jgi:hypothetical protein
VVPAGMSLQYVDLYFIGAHFSRFATIITAVWPIYGKGQAALQMVRTVLHTLNVVWYRL